jgi:hypothetical protein
VGIGYQKAGILGIGNRVQTYLVFWEVDLSARLFISVSVGVVKRTTNQEGTSGDRDGGGHISRCDFGLGVNRLGDRGYGLLRCFHLCDPCLQVLNLPLALAFFLLQMKWDVSL